LTAPISFGFERGGGLMRHGLDRNAVLQRRASDISWRARLTQQRPCML
jgi:hypothetical protein